MKILFAGNKQRGIRCLQALLSSGHNVVGAIAPPPGGVHAPTDDFAAAAGRSRLPLLQPADVNDKGFIASLKKLEADLTVLAGYGQIVRREFIDAARLGCINLHGGKLPQYRGSSPLNWALINGEAEFGLSIIQVDTGVDSGEVLLEKSFPIGPDSTIADLHAIANQAFPEMLLDVLSRFEKGSLKPRRQDESKAAYYPLRFPDDGLILWDMHTAGQIHNRIRALTDPYPGAFTYWNRRRLKLIKSSNTGHLWCGEPGRVYRNNSKGLLVCASDRCLWIERAFFEEDHADAKGTIKRYDKLATVRDLAAQSLLLSSHGDR